MRMKGALLLLAALSGGTAAAEELAVYRARGADARLFDQYDNEGYSLSVAAAPDGSVELRVRVSDAPLVSAAPFTNAPASDASLPPAPDRDGFASRLAAGSRTEEEAVRRILLGIHAAVRYDADRSRLQEPSAVFASRRAHCVGFAELAVDLLRRVGISARTVQGILRVPAGGEGYEAAIGGAYHRWIEVYYPDRGYVFSDPWSSINGVDARYIPFARRALARPHTLELDALTASGRLSYESVAAGEGFVRVRRSSSSAR